MEDFNNTLNQCDKRGGNPYPNYLFGGFSKTVLKCDLTDLDLIGYQFTWEKSIVTESWIEIRLDRIMENPKWLDEFWTFRWN